MKYCEKCGAELQPGAAFCPKCGHRVGVRVTSAAETQTKLVAQAKQMVAQIKAKVARQHTGHTKKLVLGVIAVLFAAFFAYRLLYLPNVVKSAVNANFLNTGGYTAKANTLTKTVKISANDFKLERLMTAIESNDFDTTHIGAEEQLAALEKALPGKWTVEITQHEMKDSQMVLWRYQGSEETIRYQNSEECKRAHKLALEAKAQQQSEDDAVMQGEAAGLIGGVLGAVLAR